MTCCSLWKLLHDRSEGVCQVRQVWHLLRTRVEEGLLDPVGQVVEISNGFLRNSDAGDDGDNEEGAS